MKVRDLFTNYLDAALRGKRDEERRFLIHHRQQHEALRREVALLASLVKAAQRSRELSEQARLPQEAEKRRERDRQRQSRIQTTFASADRRIAALKAQKTSGKPTGPLNPEKARKEAERVRKLNQREADIRASAAAKVGDIRSKIGQ